MWPHYLVSEIRDQQLTKSQPSLGSRWPMKWPGRRAGSERGSVSWQPVDQPPHFLWAVSEQAGTFNVELGMLSLRVREGQIFRTSRQLEQPTSLHKASPRVVAFPVSHTSLLSHTSVLFIVLFSRCSKFPSFIISFLFQEFPLFFTLGECF